MVYAFLVYGENICLIDAGVAGSHEMIFDYIRETGRNPAEISNLVITHAHPDHIGGAPAVVKETGCPVAVHADDTPWIEDIDLQYRERPIVNLYSLIPGPTKVDRQLQDGDSIDLGNGNSLQVIHTPGHSSGSISLLYPEDSALISGDAVPIPGAVPIYDDPLVSIQSVRKLMETKGLEVLLTSWAEPNRGDALYKLMDDATGYFQRIHEVVLKAKEENPAADLDELSSHILKGLGLPENAKVGIVMRTFQGHLNRAGDKDLLKAC
jgi:glyoxylase-like metal-dependent hydrolase (beta-lactamase superfamily II)